MTKGTKNLALIYQVKYMDFEVWVLSQLKMVVIEISISQIYVFMFENKKMLFILILQIFKYLFPCKINEPTR
jgi:hypothetical protein